MKMQNSNSGGKSTALVIIAAICIVIYIAALVQAIVRFYISVEQRKTTAEIEFSNIADLASSAGVLGFMDEPFIETINEALMYSKSIEAVIISGPEGEYAIERHKDRAVTWVNNSPRFRNRFDFLNISLYQPLRIHGLRNVNIQAAALAFDYADITIILKETLFIVLIGFVIAFFTLILQILLGSKGDQQSESSIQGEAATANKPVVSSVPVVEKPFPEHDAAPVNNFYEKPIYENNNLDQLSNDIANLQIDDIPPDLNNDIVVNNKNEAVDDDKFDITIDDEISGPKGLYSQRSNIGWEEYTIDRLDSELHRCASTEKDLVLIVMEFTHGISDNQFLAAADEAVNFFTSRDLLFENGEYGITIIYPGVDLETGISKSQIFQSRINEKFRLGNEVSIGMSSRSGRLLNAGRLLMEAMEALQKAKTDPMSSIIAFKSDPEKYRAYIANKS